MTTIAPPHDPVAEAELVGLALAHPEVVDEAIDGYIDPASFHDPSLGLIWRAIEAVRWRGDVPDSTTVATELGGAIASIGGSARLVTLTSGAPSRKAAAQRIRTVIAHEDRRRIAALGEAISHAAATGEDWQAILERLNRAADGASTGPAARINSEVIVGARITSLPPPAPLVHGWLDLDSIAAAYGLPSSAKTFVALGLAAAVATGSRWHGFDTEQRTVLYVVAEGIAGMGDRVRAWEDANPGHDLSRIHWLPLAPNLLEQQWVRAVSSYAARIGAGLVILDTLARVMVGADENSSRDMGTVVAAMDQIRRATAAAVLAVHHMGKAEGAGLRGHSSLLGALDTAIEVKAADGLITLETTKAKHREGGRKLRLRLVEQSRSCVLDLDRGEAFGLDNIPESRLELLRALHSADHGEGLSKTTWLKVADAAERSFYRSTKDLLALGLVQNTATGKRAMYALTDLGKEAIGANTANDLPTTPDTNSGVTANTATTFRSGSVGSSGDGELADGCA